MNEKRVKIIKGQRGLQAGCPPSYPPRGWLAYLYLPVRRNRLFSERSRGWQATVGAVDWLGNEGFWGKPQAEVP